MRDPFASDPRPFIAEAGLQPEQIDVRWDSYRSTAPRFVLARARALLTPPPTVELTLEAGALQLSGVAPRQWIADNLRLAALIPGAGSVRTDRLRDQEIVRAEALAATLDAREVRFALGSAVLDATERARVVALASDVRQLDEAAKAAGVEVSLNVLGSTDATGSESTNSRLAADRAETVVTALVSAGLSRRMFLPAGADPNRRASCHQPHGDVGLLRLAAQCLERLRPGVVAIVVAAASPPARARRRWV